MPFDRLYCLSSLHSFSVLARGQSSRLTLVSVSQSVELSWRVSREGKGPPRSCTVGLVSFVGDGGCPTGGRSAVLGQRSGASVVGSDLHRRVRVD